MVLIGSIIIVTSVVASLFIFIRYYLHSFLSPNVPLEKAEILVVEGWMDDETLKGALPTFNEGNYSQLVTVGGPLRIGAYLSGCKTLAEFSAATLAKLGCDTDKLVAVPANSTVRDRTATTAVTFRNWLQANNFNVRAINIYSYGVHARRSWLLYKKTLEPDIQVGVIAPAPITYDPTYWWRSSEGVKRVLVECIALIYTLAFLCKRPFKK